MTAVTLPHPSTADALDRLREVRAAARSDGRLAVTICVDDLTALLSAVSDEASFAQAHEDIAEERDGALADARAAARAATAATERAEAAEREAGEANARTRRLLHRVAVEAASKAWLNGAATGFHAAGMGIGWDDVASYNPHTADVVAARIESRDLVAQ